jgi:hypothetical protein
VTWSVERETSTLPEALFVAVFLSHNKRSMIMANPYLPPEIPPDGDLPEAPRVMLVERQTGFWLPLAMPSRS